MAAETMMKELMKKWMLWVLRALLLLAAVIFLNAAMYAAWQGSFPGRDISKYTMWAMIRLGVAVLYAVTLIALQVRHWRESKWLLWVLTILLLLGAWPFLLLAIQNVWLEPDPWEDKSDNVMWAVFQFGVAVVYVVTPIMLWKQHRQRRGGSAQHRKSGT
ncbi:hypothetical protein D8B29_19360 [Verminephrobacter eiseniae]|nr:hypothetical protein [Verminephrobacter eiseniae]MCW5304601.1 hypothetical protein [Verminephrobacter eiseniae]MCW8181664.1 hypothetical protein [Verminephrobacter eiseniae]MCW8192877.1 hypothetical protein [Verminephrobacter eiseniae]